MHLDLDDFRLISGLYPGLLCFVNRRLGITTTRFIKPRQFGGLPTDERIKVGGALLEHMDLIDAFVAENPFGFTDVELEIVRSWKDLVAGEFYVYRSLKNYTVFLTSDEPVVAYGVLALMDRFDDLIRPGLPHLCKAVLLPFKGRIVYDGLLAGYNVTFGGGIKRRLNESYTEAKGRFGIVTELPFDPGSARKVEQEPKPEKRAAKAGKSGGKSPATEEVRQAHDEIVGMTDAFCREHLDEEYGELCRRLAGKLARKRPSPLASGKPESWASGIVRVIGSVNFLDDPAQPHHLRMTDIDRLIGVSEATGSAKATAIRKLLKIGRFSPEWTHPGMMDRNPLAWMLEVNGLIVDARQMPREFQEAAFREGLIPYVPGDQADGSAEE
jgi:hypothetical protein